MTKIHHAAFDAHLIGVDPDFRIHVSDRLLEIHDGPFLELGLKGIAGRVIQLPRRSEDRPDPDRLALRFAFKISREDRDRSGKNSGREWDSLIKPETSLIADLNSLQGRIIFVRMRRELASNRFGIEVIPAFRGEKVSERVAAE